jgi:hypothetical protein
MSCPPWHTRAQEFLCGFPPFSGGSPDETWANLKNWEKVLQRPVYDKPQDLQFNLSDTAWNAVTRCVSRSLRRSQGSAACARAC